MFNRYKFSLLNCIKNLQEKKENLVAELHVRLYL